MECAMFAFSWLEYEAYSVQFMHCWSGWLALAGVHGQNHMQLPAYVAYMMQMCGPYRISDWRPSAGQSCAAVVSTV